MKRSIIRILLYLVIIPLFFVIKFCIRSGWGTDPMVKVQNQTIQVTDTMLNELYVYSESPKLTDLPGIDNIKEKNRLTRQLHTLTNTLLDHLKENSNKVWVMKQFQIVLINVQEEDTEAREHFGGELERIMDILNIKSSDGMLSYYLT